jgi:alpha-galactosidase
MKNIFLTACLAFHILITGSAISQTVTEQRRNTSAPMGWRSWNLVADNIDEGELRKMADALISSGMQKAGYKYLFIGDGWQGGRDKRNNIIADSKKFPSGIKALADYVHSKGLKLGIYSAAAQLTCAGYSASLNFEEQDVRTFAEWGVDYIHYDYCGVPDSAEAIARYKNMGEAIRKSGKTVEIGYTKSWLFPARPEVQPGPANTIPAITANTGVLQLVDQNYALAASTGFVQSNDSGILLADLQNKTFLESHFNDFKLSDTEFQTQMSAWSMTGSALVIAADIRKLNQETKRILINDEIIAINQDVLGKKALRMIHDENWSVYIKALSNGDYAVSIFNRKNKLSNYSISWSKLGLNDQYVIRDVWQHQLIGKGRRWRGRLLAYETRVFRLKKV